MSIHVAGGAPKEPVSQPFVYPQMQPQPQVVYQQVPMAQGSMAPAPQVVHMPSPFVPAQQQPMMQQPVMQQQPMMQQQPVMQPVMQQQPMMQPAMQQQPVMQPVMQQQPVMMQPVAAHVPAAPMAPMMAQPMMYPNMVPGGVIPMAAPVAPAPAADAAKKPEPKAEGGVINWIKSTLRSIFFCFFKSEKPEAKKDEKQVTEELQKFQSDVAQLLAPGGALTKETREKYEALLAGLSEEAQAKYAELKQNKAIVKDMQDNVALLPAAAYQWGLVRV